MKKLLLPFILFGFSATLFISCAEEQKEPPTSIEETADRAKDFIDKFSNKAKDLLDNEGGEIDKVKALIDSLANKSGDIKKLIEKNEPKIKEQLEKLKNNPDLKEAIEKLGDDSEGIVKQLEEIVKDIEKDIQ